MIIRKATCKDATRIRNLINRFANQGKMLPLSYNQIYEKLRDYWILEEKGRIIGSAALKVIWRDLGEVRSLAVIASRQNRGYGRMLITRMLTEARTLGLTKIFVLTYVPEFFLSLGFEQIPKSRLPHKIWFDCINCPKFPRCDEVSMIKYL